MASATTLMTTEELMAMPDDGVERWLINGELRESRPRLGGPPMTIRNRFHSQVLVWLCHELAKWLERQTEPCGRIVGGEAGVRLRQDPETTVGVDVAYLSAELAARQTDDTSIVDGVPILIGEILSPSDTQEDIHEKVKKYLEVGVRLVWVLNPYDRTVRVYRPGEPPQLFNEKQDLTGEPHLPGFCVRVERLFR